MVFKQDDLPIHVNIERIVIEFYSLGGKIDFLVLFYRKFVPLPCNGTTIGARSEKTLNFIPEYI